MKKQEDMSLFHYIETFGKIFWENNFTTLFNKYRFQLYQVDNPKSNSFSVYLVKTKVSTLKPKNDCIVCEIVDIFERVNEKENLKKAFGGITHVEGVSAKISGTDSYAVGDNVKISGFISPK